MSRVSQETYKFVQFVARRRWLILTLLIVAVICLEIIEHLTVSYIFGKSELIGEIVINSAIIAIAGTIVLSVFARVEKERIDAVNHLTLLKELDTSIENAHNWDDLVRTVVYFPSTFLPVLYSQLFLYHPDLEEYELIEKWGMDDSMDNILPHRYPETINRLRNSAAHANADHVHLDVYTASDDPAHRFNRLCMVLMHVNQHVALLFCYLPTDITISEEQRSILNSITNRMASAIYDSWLILRTNMKEEGVKFERRRIIQDLHDVLGQDLAYISNKLNQLTDQDTPDEFSLIQRELCRMQVVADEAYEVVRGTLVTLKASESTNLVGALEDYAKMVAERAHFQLEFACTGAHFPVPYEERWQIMGIFREILANIEKHAAAEKVDTRLIYAEDGLVLIVTDDGGGFDLEHARQNRHFGLKIIEERTRQLNGRFKIRSAVGAGTRITVSLPIDLKQIVSS